MKCIYHNSCACSCPKCSKLLTDYQQLKESETNLRTKVNELSLQISEILSQNKLLEQQNKMLLENCKMPIKRETNSNISQTQVSQLFSDFDTIITSQGLDISHLVSDRDTLMKITFKSINVIDKQNHIIEKYHNLVNHLLKYQQNSDDLTMFYLIQNEMQSLGIKKTVSNRSIEQQLLNKLKPNDTNEKKKMNYSEFEQILALLDSTGHENEIKEYIVNQNRKLDDIYKALEAEGKSQTFVLRKIRKCLSIAKESKQKSEISNDIISVFINFAKSFCDDPHVQKCTSRIQTWLSTNDRNIDIVQEIDFLLGICFPLTYSFRHPSCISNMN